MLKIFERFFWTTVIFFKVKILVTYSFEAFKKCGGFFKKLQKNLLFSPSLSFAEIFNRNWALKRNAAYLIWDQLFAFQFNATQKKKPFKCTLFR